MHIYSTLMKHPSAKTSTTRLTSSFQGILTHTHTHKLKYTNSHAFHLLSDMPYFCRFNALNQTKM